MLAPRLTPLDSLQESDPLAVPDAAIFRDASALLEGTVGGSAGFKVLLLKTIIGPTDEADASPLFVVLGAIAAVPPKHTSEVEMLSREDRGIKPY